MARQGVTDSPTPQLSPFPESAVRLGDSLRKLMDSRITPGHVAYEAITQVWTELLPRGLSEHCKIAGISAGRVKVIVDSPSYMYELQLCSSAILDELQRRCPQARLKRIKLTVG